MIPKDCKRLAEVDFPIAEVSRHAAREKSIRHGHPSTLHLWWARRPLASCRAVLLALLWPDPCDPLCPEGFKRVARELLPRVQGRVRPSDEDLRRALLRFIANFANWDLAAHPVYLEVSRALVRAAYAPEPACALHADRDGNPPACAGRYEAPLVVDPFAGGGSIPLEALRLGCEAFASDLNPVACLILKVMLEDIPRHGPELAEELRRVGAEIKREAERQLADLYPKDPDGAIPIAYLWARTVRCEAPNCGAEIPLARSFWLCKKAHRKRALRYRVEPRAGEPCLRADLPAPRARQAGTHRQAPRVEFELFEPKTEREVPGGTVARARARCLACGAVLPPERVRAQLAAERGGADVVFDAHLPAEASAQAGGRRTGGARLLAVVTLQPGKQGRHYRLPTERDYQAVRKAQQRLAAILEEWKSGSGFQPDMTGKMPVPPEHLCPVPDESTPAGGGSGAGRAFSVQKYGMRQWGDLFTARQKVALVTLARLVRDLDPHPASGARLAESEGEGVREAVRETMAMVVGRCADYGSSGVVWAQAGEFVAHTFGRQALPIVWDFAETTIGADSSGGLDGAVDWVVGVVEKWPAHAGAGRCAQVQPADAAEHPLPDETAHVWFTDPPYYDAVPYADLSDFFLVWLKRALPGHPLLRDPFDPTNPLTPKTREAVQNERSFTEDGRPKDRAFYEQAMARAFAEGRRVLHEDGIGSVVFAHKTTEGWEALLSGMVRSGWTITGSWPIATERPGRLRSQESAALATSVHLVCRPRPEDAPVGDWADVLRELPRRVGDWMERLQGEGVRGADLVFACVGPALEIFSRYCRVETADGREVTLADYLEKVWEVVGRAALEQILGTAEARAGNGAAGALEEDARLTALFLWTLQTTNGAPACALHPPARRARAGADRAAGVPSETEGEEVAAANEDEDDEEEASRRKAKGYSLVFDVVRRFAQPLGIDLPKWEGRIIETNKGVVRLLPIAERARILFGKEGADAVAHRLEKAPAANSPQMMLFMESEEAAATTGMEGSRGRRKAGVNMADLPAATAAQAGEVLETSGRATTLDRVHMAMLLQAGGQANALRALLKAEQERGPDFLRLANALSALYPKGSEEKRLLDAMLLAVPR